VEYIKILNTIWKETDVNKDFDEKVHRHKFEIILNLFARLLGFFNEKGEVDLEKTITYIFTILHAPVTSFFIYSKMRKYFPKTKIYIMLDELVDEKYLERIDVRVKGLEKEYFPRPIEDVLKDKLEEHLGKKEIKQEEIIKAIKELIKKWGFPEEIAKEVVEFEEKLSKKIKSREKYASIFTVRVLKDRLYLIKDFLLDYDTIKIYSYSSNDLWYAIKELTKKDRSIEFLLKEKHIFYLTFDSNEEIINEIKKISKNITIYLLSPKKIKDIENVVWGGENYKDPIIALFYSREEKLKKKEGCIINFSGHPFKGIIIEDSKVIAFLDFIFSVLLKSFKVKEIKGGL
jgi:hypothetical protein